MACRRLPLIGIANKTQCTKSKQITIAEVLSVLIILVLRSGVFFVRNLPANCYSATVPVKRSAMATTTRRKMKRGTGQHTMGGGAGGNLQVKQLNHVTFVSAEFHCNVTQPRALYTQLYRQRHALTHIVSAIWRDVNRQRRTTTAMFRPMTENNNNSNERKYGTFNA